MKWFEFWKIRETCLKLHIFLSFHFNKKKLKKKNTEKEHHKHMFLPMPLWFRFRSTLLTWNVGKSSTVTTLLIHNHKDGNVISLVLKQKFWFQMLQPDTMSTTKTSLYLRKFMQTEKYFVKEESKHLIYIHREAPRPTLFLFISSPSSSSSLIYFH